MDTLENAFAELTLAKDKDIERGEVTAEDIEPRITELLALFMVFENVIPDVKGEFRSVSMVILVRC